MASLCVVGRTAVRPLYLVGRTAVRPYLASLRGWHLRLSVVVGRTAVRPLYLGGRTAVRPNPHPCWGLSVAEALPSSLLEALFG